MYINAYMWNLEKWYTWAYLKGGNRDADVENWRVDSGMRGRRGWDELGEWDWQLYTSMFETDSYNIVKQLYSN